MFSFNPNTKIISLILTKKLFIIINSMIHSNYRLKDIINLTFISFLNYTYLNDQIKK